MALLKSARVSYRLKILSAEVFCVLLLPTHGFVSHINKERGVSSRAGHSTVSAGRSTLLTPTEIIHQSFTSEWKPTSSPALVHEAFSAFSYETGTLLNCIAPLLLPLLFFFFFLFGNHNPGSILSTICSRRYRGGFSADITET